jgi:hypothetical protein
MESNYYQRDLQDELSNASSINGPYHSAKTVFYLLPVLDLAKIKKGDSV